MMLEPDWLDSVYRKWKYPDQGNETHYPSRYMHRPRDQRFEDWLWTQGFTVVQKDKKRYLKFSGEEHYLTLFLLRWA